MPIIALGRFLVVVAAVAVVVVDCPAWGEDFSVVVLPDTQLYSCECNGASNDTYIAQTEWIVDQQWAWNIAFVTHEGDIVENYDDIEQEWINADVAMSVLEDPATTGLADGMPYGVVCGNHDQGEDADHELYFNQYFGVDRFAGRSYYGGHFGDDNTNNYQLFSASGLDFLVMHLEWREVGDPEAMDWADEVLADHPDRIAIVVSHYVLNIGNNFAGLGQTIYEVLRHHDNFALLLGGHLPGEGRRTDEFDGSTVHTMLANYQNLANGGDGWLRILQFSPDNNEIRVFTYSPTRDEFDTDDASQFVLNYDLGGGGPADDDDDTSADDDASDDDDDDDDAVDDDITDDDAATDDDTGDGVVLGDQGCNCHTAAARHSAPYTLLLLLAASRRKPGVRSFVD